MHKEPMYLIIFTIFVSFIVMVFYSIYCMNKANEEQDIINKESINSFPIQSKFVISKPVIPVQNQVFATIMIPKIDLTTNIIEGATQDNLKISPCHIYGTPFLWENGVSFISGHRSWTYGKMFNRLDELIKGDLIYITSNEKVYLYSVDSKEIVKPDNTEVFNKVIGQKSLTLTTCTPLYSATDRLIVYCKSIE